MSFSRRDFLKTAAASAVLSTFHPIAGLAESKRSQVLEAGVFKQKVVAGGQETTVWGYNGSVPGPLLRFRQGDTVRLELKNSLLDESTIHWHGLRVPNAMDGVPQVTQTPVPRGGSFAYEFTLQDSGTFWYHPHQKSFEQVGRGLYGGFIVEEAKPLEVDREVVWLISDFKLDGSNQQVEDYGSIKDVASIGRLGNVVTLNGEAVGRSKLDVRSGERLRLRIMNVATARVMSFRFAGHQPKIIAWDGQAVEPHEPAGGAVMLGPGMRADMILDCLGKPGESFAITDAWSKNREIAKIVYSGEKPLRAKASGAPILLARNPIPEVDLDNASRHRVVFQGGTSGQPVVGLVDGRPVKMQDLMAQKGLAWILNLSAAHEHALVHEPFLFLKRGEHTVISLVNATGFEHPIHLHGHTFRVLSYNGKPPKYPELRDTVFMGPRESVDIAFVADNPGDWMFHCHILEHAAGGMMGTIRVG